MPQHCERTLNSSCLIAAWHLQLLQHIAIWRLHVHAHIFSSASLRTGAEGSREAFIAYLTQYVRRSGLRRTWAAVKVDELLWILLLMFPLPHTECIQYGEEGTC